MSRQDAVTAYRDSLYDGLKYEMETRVGSRSFPIVGGLVPAIKQFGNALYRPFKVTGALVLGYGEPRSGMPALPAMPEEFKGTDLGSAFTQSAELRQKAIEARTESFGQLLNFDIGGAWKQASVASYAESRDRHVVFPEEGEAINAAANSRASFVAQIGNSQSSGPSR